MSAERLRIVQIIPNPEAGGLENVATALTIALLPHVDRIVVCSSGGSPHVIHAQKPAASVQPGQHLAQLSPMLDRPGAFARATAAVILLTVLLAVAYSAFYVLVGVRLQPRRAPQDPEAALSAFTALASGHDPGIHRSRRQPR